MPYDSSGTSRYFVLEVRDDAGALIATRQVRAYPGRQPSNERVFITAGYELCREAIKHAGWGRAE